MDFTDKHPAELHFNQMIKEVKSLLEKCENQFLDVDEKEVLKKELKPIKEKIFDLQIERLSNHINDRGKVENLLKEEEDLQREMTELTIRINKFLKVD